MNTHFGKTPAGRLAGFAFVVLLHAVLIYILAMGLGQKVIELVQPPILATLIEETTPPPELPPPPPPQFSPPPTAYIPLPEIQIKLAPPPRAIAAIAHEPPPAPPAPPAPRAAEPVAVARTSAEIDPSTQCRKPNYPPAAKRLQEQGTVVLKFRIGADGGVLAGSIETSSGHERLDQAALDGLSLCRFKPGTVNGVAEESSALIKYVWRLER